MNASGRRCREFQNGFRKFAKICGKSFAGGRSQYASTASRTVAESIARERAMAARYAQMKKKKK